MQVPMIWCPAVDKNVAIEDLRLDVVWENTADYVKCSLNWYLGDKLVRCSAHALTKADLPFGAEQAQM